MKLYLLQRVGKVGWDEAAGFVVCARSAKHARQQL